MISASGAGINKPKRTQDVVAAGPIVGSTGCKAVHQLLKLKPYGQNFRTMKPEPSTATAACTACGRPRCAVAELKTQNHPCSACYIADLCLFFKLI